MTGSLVGKFLRLSSTERGLFVRAVLTLAAARVTTWALPFNLARRLVVARPRGAVADSFTHEQIGWAIAQAQRLWAGKSFGVRSSSLESPGAAARFNPAGKFWGGNGGGWAS